MYVPYRIRPGDPPGSQRKPWLVLYVGRFMMPEWAMIDSGTSHSVLPPHVADELGVKYDPAFPNTGRGAAKGFRYSETTVSVPIVTELGMTITLVQPVVSDYPGFTLLGQDDFFMGFVVTLDAESGAMDLSQKKEKMGFIKKRN